jgi:diguanylate cyclase (GGDEF)-like protein
MKEKPELLRLNRFLPFIATVASNKYALALFDPSGNPVIIETTPANSFTDQLPKLLEQIKIDWCDFSDTHDFSPITPLVALLRLNFQLGASQKPFYLSLIVQQDLSDLERQHLFSLLNNISLCLIEDYNLDLALSGMADELAVRYEELNLFYGMDDSESLTSNHNEYEALTQLITNSSDYLNIDLILLLLPEQNLVIQHLALNNNLQNRQTEILEAIKGSLCQRLVESRETIVINRDSDTDWTDANFKIPSKIIAAPVHSSKNKQGGILVLINSLQKPDFSNSDRKLCEVIAAEASKLIQARHDTLTGFYNRQGFMERLEQCVIATNTQQQSVLLFIDIDQFKIVNDTSGQVAGDQLLNQTGALIKKELMETDTLARMGSDEFAVLFENCSLSEAERRAEKIRLAIKQFRYFYKEKMFDIAVSIGVVRIDTQIDNFSDIMGKADLACNIAKELGGNRIHVYHSSDQNTAKREDELQWVSRINQALEKDQFLLYRQLILPLHDSSGYEPHFEILLRLRDETGKIISPFFFIPAAERYNLMPKIDRWVIKNALYKMATAQTSPPLSCSINLSGQSFCESGFVEFVMEQIRKSGVAAKNICFEITETAAVSNLAQAVDFINTLKNIGCKFSLDDFGSGMSSFTYLKNLPVDYLKIDGYFVKNMLEDKIDHAMVASINQIGQVMELKTIAEFVENDAILQELKIMGIDYGQGYGIGKPEPFPV